MKTVESVEVRIINVNAASVQHTHACGRTELERWLQMPHYRMIKEEI